MTKIGKRIIKNLYISTFPSKSFEHLIYTKHFYVRHVIAYRDCGISLDYELLEWDQTHCKNICEQALTCGQW